jgi:hypothetical protein
MCPGLGDVASEGLLSNISSNRVEGMELGDPAERAARSPLDVLLNKLNDNLNQLLETVESGGLDHLDAAEKISWWQRFETFRNRLPLIDHRLIADAGATDLASTYGFTNLNRFLTRILQLSPGRGRLPGPRCCGGRPPHVDARRTPRTGVAEAGRAATPRAVTTEKVQIVERAMDKLSRAGLDPEAVQTAEHLLTDYAPVLGPPICTATPSG